MAGAGGSDEFEACKRLVHSGIEGVGLLNVGIVVELVAEVVNAGSEGHAGASGRDVVVAQRGVQVGVAEGIVFVEREAVARVVAEHLHAVVGVEHVVQRDVGVVEARGSPGIVAAGRNLLEEPVGIGGAAAHQEGGLALACQRAFEVEAAGEQAYAQGALHLFDVAGLAVDSEHRGDAAAVFGGDAALVEVHIGHDVGVERREDAEEMRGVVDGALVEEDQVLVGRAAADVEAAGGLAYRLHAGEGEHRLEDVALAEGGGNLVEGLDAHVLEAHLRRAVVHAGLVGNHGRVELGGLHVHGEVEFAVAVDDYHQVDVFLAGFHEVEHVLAHGQPQLPAAVGAGGGVGAGERIGHHDAWKRFVELAVHDRSVDPCRSGGVLALLSYGVNLVAEGDVEAGAGLCQCVGLVPFFEIAVGKHRLEVFGLRGVHCRLADVGAAALDGVPVGHQAVQHALPALVEEGEGLVEIGPFGHRHTVEAGCAHVAPELGGPGAEQLGDAALAIQFVEAAFFGEHVERLGIVVEREAVGVVLGVVVADEHAVVSGAGAETAVDTPQEGAGAVEDHFVEARFGAADSLVLQVHETDFCPLYPGQLVPFGDAGGVGHVGTHVHQAGGSIHPEEDVFVETAVEHGFARLKTGGIPVRGAVECIGRRNSHPSPVYHG